MNDIGLLIRQKRKEKHLTLEELAHKLNIGKSTLSKYERGAITNLKRDKMVVLCDLLDIEPLSFIHGTDIEMTQEITIADFKIELSHLLCKTKGLTETEKKLIKDYVRLVCSTKGD